MSAEKVVPAATALSPAKIAPTEPPTVPAEATAEPLPLDLSIPADLDAQLNTRPMESYERTAPNFFGTAEKKNKKTSISGSVIHDEERPLDINGVQGGEITIKTEFD
ncbi:hypothetical protein EYC98_07155 [Halieaceae bacterium IMCC14734]|uniref:Uncharacterized protein n=1 Tax=Candidatus Litorirhabdus singularis TaxID=2518993 RepID=A0ABT3TEB6_9GAMM|nr:hypothetical protein [Candidatus Litorirhabdus singularis]MCX2980653.1 hypothetical protein [Candidatus Litorirhabdus singularis]